MSRRPALLRPFTKAHAALGFHKFTDWHWQKRTEKGILDFWPSKSKWMIDGAVKTGTFDQMLEDASSL